MASVAPRTSGDGYAAFRCAAVVSTLGNGLDGLPERAGSAVRGAACLDVDKQVPRPEVPGRGRSTRAPGGPDDHEDDYHEASAT